MTQETRDVVNGLVVRKGVVLLARRSVFRESYPGKWSFPGGHVEAGEALTSALIRELQEEVGISPTEFGHLRSSPDPNGFVVYHFFEVTAWQGGMPVLRGAEHSELRWFRPSDAIELPDLAVPCYRTLLINLMRA
ncbi:MAG: NUDIX domain-containing protein [Pseudomonadota bacterium]